jgi:hypothetical protein
MRLQVSLCETNAWCLLLVNIRLQVPLTARIRLTLCAGDLNVGLLVL